MVRSSMNFKQWCCVNSYIGWLKWCDAYRLKGKWIEPLKNRLILYYYTVMGNRKRYKKNLLFNFSIE